MLWMQIWLTDQRSLYSTFPSPAQHAQLWKFVEKCRLYQHSYLCKVDIQLHADNLKRLHTSDKLLSVWHLRGIYAFPGWVPKKKYAKVTGRTNTRLIANPITYHNCAKSPPTRGDVWSSRSRRFWIIIMLKFTAIEFAAIAKFNKPFVAIGF